MCLLFVLRALSLGISSHTETKGCRPLVRLPIVVPATSCPISEPKREALPPQPSLYDFTTLSLFEKGLFDQWLVSISNFAFSISYSAQDFLVSISQHIQD